METCLDQIIQLLSYPATGEKPKANPLTRYPREAGANLLHLLIAGSSGAHTPPPRKTVIRTHFSNLPGARA
jgi:hypothetical protein